MKILARFTEIALVTFFCTGCAAILSGKTQTITLNTNPPGARCEVIREGRVVGTVENTPGTVTLDKTKHNMDIVCKKGGFRESKDFAKSGNDGYVLGNIILGGGIGWAVDSAIGADNRYPDELIITLAPVQSASSGGSKGSATIEKPAALDDRARLESLKKMRDDGLMTDEEYQKKRAALVEKL